jgi:hypothetical protein
LDVLGALGGAVAVQGDWGPTDETAMRHGVPLVAIREFLMEHLPEFSTGEDLNVSSDAPGEQPEVIVID